MAIEFGPSGNSSRYYSMPDNAALTRPNTDWSIFSLLYFNSTAPSGEDIISQGSYGVSQSNNIYIYSSDIGLKVHTRPDSLVGFSAGIWYGVLARRQGTSLTIRRAPIGSKTVTVGNTVTITAGYDSTSSFAIGRRSDVGNYFNGRVSDVIYIPGYAMSSSELLDIVNGVPMQASSWWDYRSVHFYFNNASQANVIDLTQRLAMTRNGTGYSRGSTEIDPPLIKRFIDSPNNTIITSQGIAPPAGGGVTTGRLFFGVGT